MRTSFMLRLFCGDTISEGFVVFQKQLEKSTPEEEGKPGTPPNEWRNSSPCPVQVIVPANHVHIHSVKRYRTRGERLDDVVHLVICLVFLGEKFGIYGSLSSRDPR